MNDDEILHCRLCGMQNFRVGKATLKRECLPVKENGLSKQRKLTFEENKKCTPRFSELIRVEADKTVLLRSFLMNVSNWVTR